MDQESHEISLGDTAWFASLAYIVVLLPWTIFFAHDFIADRWDTIRHTRRIGILHSLVFILAPVLVAYISLQPRSQEPDFKEMFTALTALLFGFYHFLRSLEGIIQLFWLRDWATEVGKLMDRGGYWQELQLFNGGNQFRYKRQTWKEKKLPESQKPRMASSQYPQKLGVVRRVSKKVDMMRVNNSIVDNELAASQCPNVAYALQKKTIHSWILLFWYRIVQLFAGEQRDLVEAKLTTFVRWAVAFLSQFGDTWLRDVAGTTLVQTELRRTNKRCEFAAKVLAAATLRMGQMEWLLKESNKSDSELNLLDQKSYLPLGAWHRITKRDEDIVFSREAFASASFRTSFHMPGRNPVLIEGHSDEDIHQKGNIHHYQRFLDPLIAEARSLLHPTLREYLQRHGKFSSQQLEWFAAFLCTQCAFEFKPKKADYSSSQKPAKQDSNAKVKVSLGHRKGRENENNTAVRLLRRQLGFEDSVASRTFFYPFLKDAYERHFWGNRAILEVSARIDNWTAICSGRHVYFLQERQQFWVTDKFPRAHGHLTRYPRVSCDGDLSEYLKPDSSYHESDNLDTKNKEQSKKTFEFHRQLEIETLKYQLTDKETAHWHMEHGLSFLGCVVESIRSALAEQIFLRGSSLHGWCPKLPDKKVKFFPSLELWNCINSAQVFDTAVQERLLWECQQGVYSSLRRNVTRKPEFGGFPIHEEVEMMLLFVMGFPSIEIRRDSQDICVFTIRPALAPQPLQVHVFIHKGKYDPLGRIKPTAVLRIETWFENGSKWAAPTDRFCWRDWRDAFEGRLDGRFQWQQDHFLPAAPITRGTDRRETLAKSTKEIRAHAKGQKPPLVWDGWEPFRPSMAIFELKHILSSKETKRFDNSESQIIKRHKSSSEAYHHKRTTPALLSSAMLRLDALLGHGEGLEKLNKDLQKRKFPTKRFEPRRNILAEFGKRISLFSFSEREEDDGRSKDPQSRIDKLLDHAKAFEAESMYELACYLDYFEFPNPELIFNLMQGALHIDRAVHMAKSVIDKLLVGVSTLSTQKRQEVIQKARYAVDLLWLDVEAKHKKIWKANAREMNEEELERWVEKSNGEKKRLTVIIELHMRILRAQSTSTMMNELAERITRYGTLKTHEETAIELYESAVIANADPRPILKLATIHASRTFDKNDRDYARDLLRKALHVAKTGPHCDILDSHAVRLQSESAVMEELYELAKSGDRGATWLFEKHYKVLRNSNDEDEQGLHEHLRSFLLRDGRNKNAQQFQTDDMSDFELKIIP